MKKYETSWKAVKKTEFNRFSCIIGVYFPAFDIVERKYITNEIIETEEYFSFVLESLNNFTGNRFAWKMC